MICHSVSPGPLTHGRWGEDVPNQGGRLCGGLEFPLDLVWTFVQETPQGRGMGARSWPSAAGTARTAV